MKMTSREILWITLVVAMALGWLLENKMLRDTIAERDAKIEQLSNRRVEYIEGLDLVINPPQSTGPPAKAMDAAEKQKFVEELQKRMQGEKRFGAPDR